MFRDVMRCLLCSDPCDPHFSICQNCLNELPRNNNHCRLCAVPLPDVQPQGAICGRCLKKAPEFDQLHAPYLYEAPCDFMLQQLKFSEKRYFARAAGNLLANYLREQSATGVDFILPVPLHNSRLLERGFNQSFEIGRYISNALNIPLINGLLTKQQETAPQMSLSAKERQKNVRNVFAVEKWLEGKSVAVVDDVVTTGSTVNEIARTLKRSGADKVFIWAFARAPTKTQARSTVI